MPTHTPPPNKFDYPQVLHAEHHLLADVSVPIITVSATFRHELAQTFHQSLPSDEVVFSRAHYSMALAVLQTALKRHQSSWLVDPTNYVTHNDWSRLDATEEVGKLIARHPLLKDVKDVIDTRLRSQSPLTSLINQPLIYLAQKVTRPLISLHYEAGNILSAAGHPILQVVTDPHVRPQYLDPLPDQTVSPHQPQPSPITFCVFDETTKTDFLLLAREHHKHFNSSQVVVTGPPVDPRILSARKHKPLYKSNQSNHPLRLVITTGGLGQNYPEIKSILNQLSTHIIHRKQPRIQLILYASTHLDFQSLFTRFARRANLVISPASRQNASLRILYAPTIAAANKLLIDHAFPWADAFITKPSGDMAYDAAASGSVCLFLDSWGEWEDNILTRFQAHQIGLPLQTGQITTHLQALTQPYWQGHNYFSFAQQNTHSLPDTYTKGAANILKTYPKRF